MVCPLTNVFLKALEGPEDKKDDSDGISLDSSCALLSKIQTDKYWRSSSLSGLVIPLLLDVMYMHRLS